MIMRQETRQTTHCRASGFVVRLWWCLISTVQVRAGEKPHLRSWRLLRHREVGWEATRSERPVCRRTNAIRRDGAASLRRSGEAWNPSVTLPWRSKRWPGPSCGWRLNGRTVRHSK